MRAIIMQPNYLPWIGYFDLIKQSDAFVFLDNVQFEKQSWQSRNRIKTQKGWQWLIVPVFQKLGQKIREVKINNNTNWYEKHWKSVRFSYGKAPYFKNYEKFFESLYLEKKWEFLMDLDIEITKYIAKELGLKPKFVFASDLNVEGEQTDRLINICKELNANEYLSPVGSKAYIEADKFKNAKIKLEYMDFEHPVYQQLYGEFIPQLSAIDLLFNCGPKSKETIWGKNNGK